MKMKYRPDIDGLRTVAVVPILLFHAGLSVLGGGFVGVDIFFVISGFLITTIILREIEAKEFSIVRFYHRRVSRIFPALFVMLLATLAAGLLLMLPTEIRALGRSAAAASAFGANIYFWATTDYFAQAAEATPLLHTWSLGVEEQFYLFYPLVVLAIERFIPSRLKLCLWGLVIGSFLVGGVLVKLSPPAAFYLIPARAWQLGLGGLMAAGALPDVGSARLRGALAALGGVLIVIAYFVIRSDMPFPVPWGLIPCLGAVLLIQYAPGTSAARLLSLPPMVAVGRISYSLYLWHWPIITFWRLENGFHLSGEDTAILVAASFIAATLSYYLVERPALRLFRESPTGRTVMLGAAGVAAMASLAIAAPAAGPLQKIDPGVVRIESFADYRDRPEYQVQFRRGPCFRGEDDPFRPDICYRLATDRPNIVVMGDSHAAQYWRALVDRFPKSNVIQATASGCRPLITDEGARRCTQVMDYIYQRVLPTGRVSALFLAGRWTEEDMPGLAKTLTQLKRQYPALKIILMGPTIEYNGDFPALLARAELRGNVSNMARELVAGPLAMDGEVAAIARRSNIPYVSVRHIICPDRCFLYAPDGGPMEFDYGHLTLSASHWVIGRVPATMF